ncbi:MAG TPA: hypothetical protein VMF06_25155 [Candidatus Limnocylindria bacterium]|nr:hypothetical protein [Candidatus Limnocylindria bacterium]
MSKPVLGRGLGSLLGSGENKSQSEASEKGVGLLLRGSSLVSPPSANPTSTAATPASIEVTPVAAAPEVTPIAKEALPPNAPREIQPLAQPLASTAKPAPSLTRSRPVAAAPVPAPALTPVPSSGSAATESSLEKEAQPEPLWRNPLTWLVAADVVFVTLAGWIAVAGQSPIRWLAVILLMLIAGSIGVVGYCLPGVTPVAQVKPEPVDKRKIRVHFVDELPKRRS